MITPHIHTRIAHFTPKMQAVSAGGGPPMRPSGHSHVGSGRTSDQPPILTKLLITLRLELILLQYWASVRFIAIEIGRTAVPSADALDTLDALVGNAIL